MSDNLRRKREEDTMTLGDIIDEVTEYEETATAVLGASDNDHCSYDKGYVKRQALYSCLTCNPPGSSTSVRAGICLACTLKCHDGHNLVELYTKRNFRCDCGNSKFPGTRCSLQPNKDLINDKNAYNHNFDGLYCICSRPYPDPEEEDEEEDEMLQCIICEDWLHGRHTLNDAVDIETDIDEAEFICESCMKKLDFLPHYASLQLTENTPQEAAVAESTEVVVQVQAEPKGFKQNSSDCNGITPLNSDQETIPGDPAEGINDLHAAVGLLPDQITLSRESDADEACSQDSGIGSATEPLESNSESSLGTDEHSCLFNSIFKETAALSGGTWWPSSWRNKLCRCNSCKETYDRLDVAFLMDPEDPLDFYEAQGKANGGVALDEIGQNLIQSALAGLDRVQQIEIVHGFNEMKEALGQFLSGFVGTDRVVTPEDIHTFFAEMRANKRRRLDDVYVPDSCR